MKACRQSPQAVAGLLVASILLCAGPAQATKGSPRQLVSPQRVRSIGPRSPVPTYSADGRAPLNDLYAAYDKMARDHGWIREVIYRQGVTVDGKRYRLPVVTYRTPWTGKAMWITAGIHGEEPSGPNALAQATTLEKLAQVAKDRHIPMVLMPLINPAGYRKNWRHPNTPRNEDKSQSVSDAWGVLAGLPKEGQDPMRPRAAKPSSAGAHAITTWIARMSARYPTFDHLDLHQDDLLAPGTSYLYSQTKAGANDPVAKMLRTLVRQSGFPTVDGRNVPALAANGLPTVTGVTRFGEKIVRGIVPTVNDGSINDLMAATRVILDGKVVRKRGAKSVVIPDLALQGRPGGKNPIETHTRILFSVEKIWDLLNRPAPREPARKGKTS